MSQLTVTTTSVQLPQMVHGSVDSLFLQAGDEQLSFIRRADIPDAALSSYIMALKAEPQTRALAYNCTVLSLCVFDLQHTKNTGFVTVS